MKVESVFGGLYSPRAPLHGTTPNGSRECARRTLMHILHHFESGAGSRDMSVSFGGEVQKERGGNAKGTNSVHHSMPQDVGSEANAKTISSRISNLPRPLPPLPAGQKGARGGIERGRRQKRTRRR
jgi:hypothetical protein